MCDSFTLKQIFSTYCERFFYGCELFHFTKPYMSKLYISWRKSIRYIFDSLLELIIILCLIWEIVLYNH